MRPFRVGSTEQSPLDLLSADPFPPLVHRPRRTELLAEALGCEVVGDLLSGDLQAEEGVDAGEVPAQRCGARGVETTRFATRAAHLERALHVEAPQRVAA